MLLNDVSLMELPIQYFFSAKKIIFNTVEILRPTKNSSENLHHLFMRRFKAIKWSSNSFFDSFLWIFIGRKGGKEQFIRYDRNQKN